MSLTQALCNQCEKPLIYDFGDESYSITITEHRKHCPKCFQSLTRENQVYFCSLKCLKEWVAVYEVKTQ